tara:strand:- start:11078 stop:11227 length:150 start_codon:yes stop_codon:yes gene_type:complete
MALIMHLRMKRHRGHAARIFGTATADQVRKVVAWLLKREGLDLTGGPDA